MKQNVARQFLSNESAKEAVAISKVLSQGNRERVVKLLTDRKKSERHGSDKRERTSAVLFPLVSVQGKPSLLLTRRTRSLLSHRNEICFPGGKVDEEDCGSACRTAVRETCEELGLEETDIDVWGDFMYDGGTFVRGRYLTTPVIAHLGSFEQLKFSLSKHEVQSVFTVSLEHLADQNNQVYTVFKMVRPNDRISMYVGPAFEHPKGRIWGLTAFVIYGVLPLVYPDFKLRYRVKVR